jgi:hypothetical protein
MITLSSSLATLIFAGCALPTAGGNFGQGYDAKLIKVGANVPNATVTIPGGKSVKLYSLIQGKKAALINFWFFH